MAAKLILNKRKSMRSPYRSVQLSEAAYDQLADLAAKLNYSKAHLLGLAVDHLVKTAEVRAA